jgi:hypothetical protein
MSLEFIIFIAIPHFIIYITSPFILYKKYSVEKKISLRWIFFILVILILDPISANNFSHVLILFYDYFFWKHPLELSFSYQQVYVALFLFLFPFLLKYIILYFSKNWFKYIFYTLIIHCILIFLQVSPLLYSMIFEKAWFITF